MSTISDKNPNNSNPIEVILTSMDPKKSNPTDAKQIAAIREITGNFSLISKNRPVELLAIQVKELYTQRIVGTLYARVLGDDIFSLDLLCIEEANRKQKIGSKLLELAEKYAHESKAKKIALCTYDFQAPEFYEKKGYRRISEIKNALDHHSLIFFEKPVPEHPSPLVDLKDIQLEIYTKVDINEEKEVFSHAVQGMLDYNLQFLQAESKTERDFVEFALVIYPNNLKNREFDKEAAQILKPGTSDNVLEQGASECSKFVAKPTPSKTDASSCLGIKEDDQILGVITGLLVKGSENGAITIDSIGFKKGLENNSDIRKQLIEALEKLGIEHKCSNLVPYDQVVQNAFDHLGSSKYSNLTFRRIIPLK